MSQTTLSRTPELPVYMARNGFDPVPDLLTAPRVARVRTPFGLDAWMVSRHDDVREVLADTARFSNARRLGDFPGFEDLSEEELARMRAGNLLSFDPPDHTRLRRFLIPEFTGPRIRRLEPRVREIVDDCLDAMERGGPPADVVPAFALPVPSLVICELLGVPYTDRDGFQERTRDLLDVSKPPKERRRLSEESRAYMASLVAREQRAPGDALLGSLIREHGDDLSTDELIGIAGLLLIAGHETTSNMLGLGTLALLRDPAQLARVRDDDAAVGPAVEELLRWLSIVHTGAFRTTVSDVEFGEYRIPAGELVLCALAAANRDAAATDDPDRLDVSRGVIGHLAFPCGVRPDQLRGVLVIRRGTPRASKRAHLGPSYGCCQHVHATASVLNSFWRRRLGFSDGGLSRTSEGGAVVESSAARPD
jgi:cytochrome P450